MIFLIKKSVAKEILKSLGKNKLEELKREVIEILKKQDEKEYKKALSQFENEEKNMSYLEKSNSGEWIEKAGYGIGTVRIWKGKKYKKIAPGKWARLYEKEGRGTNIAVGKLIAKVKKIDDIEELMNFVMQNKQRFQDENGMDLPILDKIRAEVDRQSGKIGSKGKSENTEKEEETNIDNDFNKMIARIKNDYPNMPKEAEESLKEEYKRMGISKEKWIEYREKLFKNKEEEKKREEQRKQEKNNEKEEKINKYVKHIKNQLGIGDVGDSLYKKEEYVSILNDTIQKYGKKSIMGIAAQRIIDNMKESEPVKKEAKQQNNFSLDDIKSKKTIKTVEEFEDVIRQLAAEKNQDNAESKFIDFLGYNLEGGMAGSLYDKIFEKYGDTSYSTLKKQVKGQKISEREKNIGYADEYANKEEEKSKKKENSKNIQNQMTPKQQKTFDDFEKKAIKNAGNIDRGKRFAKHNYNIDGEDWTITTDGRVMLCSREKFEEPTKTDKITNMDKVFLINGQKESAIPDGIDAIIKAAPKTVVTGKGYNGKGKKEFSIIKLGDRYFKTDYLKTVQNFLGPLSNAKMQVIPEDNKSRVKFESGNKAVVLLPIEIDAELENRIINTNDIKKSLEDIIMFCNDFEDEDEVIEEINNESLFSDYSAENPSEFNSIKYKVANAFEECGY